MSAAWYVTNDTLHHDLNVPYVRDKIKRLGQRYADRKHLNILAINFMKKSQNTPIKEKTKIYVPDRTVIYRAYATGHMLFKISINCQMYYRMLRKVTACNNS